MRIELSGQSHVQITDDLRDHVQEKAQHLNRIFDGITTLHVALDSQRGQAIAEFVANVSHGAPAVAKAAADTLHAAVQTAADKVEAQLRKHKDKLRDHRPRPSKSPPEPTPAAEEDTDSWETNSTTE